MLCVCCVVCVLCGVQCMLRGLVCRWCCVHGCLEMRVVCVVCVERWVSWCACGLLCVAVLGVSFVA